MLFTRFADDKICGNDRSDEIQFFIERFYLIKKNYLFSKKCLLSMPTFIKLLVS